MFPLLALFGCLLVVAAADKYAMVISVNNDWDGYFINSESCRVYDTLVKGGIKQENIIFMTHTDVVKSSSNPFPGMIFTDPAPDTSGDWVQYGCYDHVDYTGKDIRKEVILGILSGDAEAVSKITGKEDPKVLAAGPDDTVFTYFIARGGAGYISIDYDLLFSADLSDAIKTAFEKKLYGKWVWFMESCFAGSMFYTVEENWNLYAMTSSDAHHMSYMNWCPPYDVVAEKSFNTCLAGLWDNLFLEYLQQHPTTTIGDLYKDVKTAIKPKTDQNVNEYGDLSFKDLPLSDFVGEVPATRVVKKDVKSIVSVDAVPRHLSKWEAIRADKNELKRAIVEYERIVKEEAKREVEVMRLGVSLMNEKSADAALKNGSESYSADCVRDLSIGLHDKCGHSFPLSESSMNVLRSICLPGLRVPEVDWSVICL